MRTHCAVALCSSLSVLAGCGGGGEDSAATAPLSVRITDAPVDAADIERVCILFSGITVHYSGRDDVTLEYAPLASQVRPETHCIGAGTTWNGVPPVPPVRLDALGGPLTVALAESLQVPVGRITWIRLHFVPGGSYVLENDGGLFSMPDDLRCPSCEVTDNNTRRGFKLNRTFEVTSDGLAVTVDIDLGASLHRDANGYVLRPTARIEPDGALGTIAGDVADATIADAGGTIYTGGDVDTGCAVYVFAGHDAPLDDFHDASAVVTTARVRFHEATGFYRYAAGALVGGTSAVPNPYTVALTCDPDDPEVDHDPDDAAAENPVRFSPAQNADVVAGLTTPVDF